MRHGWLILLVPFFFACGENIVRNKIAYQTDMAFFKQASKEQSDAGEKLLRVRCACSDVSGILMFTTPECQKMAETIQQARVWVPYIADRALYSAGLLKELPPQPVPKPDVDLCPGGE